MRLIHKNAWYAPELTKAINHVVKNLMGYIGRNKKIDFFLIYEVVPKSQMF
jgi:hypothetical protein